jgi:hypothetical protein
MQVIMQRKSYKSTATCKSTLSRVVVLLAALRWVPVVQGDLVASRQVSLWLDGGPSPTNVTWAVWNSKIAAHRCNVTGIAPWAYFVSDNGKFISRYNDTAIATIAAGWMQYFATNQNLRVRPLVAASSAGIALAACIPAVGEALGAAMLAQALLLRHTGFSIQLDGDPGGDTPLAKAQWTALLASWLATFNAAGLDLSVIIVGSCARTGRMEAFNMTCADYRAIALNATDPHTNLRVISQATFTPDPNEWKTASNSLLHGLGPSIVSLGMLYNPPLVDPTHDCLTYALAGGIAVLYVWGDVPARNEAWDAFGFWLNGVF